MNETMTEERRDYLRGLQKRALQSYKQDWCINHTRADDREDFVCSGPGEYHYTGGYRKGFEDGSILGSTVLGSTRNIESANIIHKSMAFDALMFRQGRPANAPLDDRELSCLTELHLTIEKLRKKIGS